MRRFLTADMFCGAGGSSEGTCEAVRLLGYDPQLTAMNHNAAALATHQANHPTARHLCTSIHNINPRDLYQPRELQLLWASPECTHHSVARGGKPIRDQSRATAWCVVKWADALLPEIILVENVPEFRTWGPLDARDRPIKSRKGEIFQSWVANLRALGYRVDWKDVVAADHGDPTTRRRLIIQAVRGRRRVVWPDATHAPRGGNHELRDHVAAREIIDWSLKGQWIDEMKPKKRYGGLPLSPNTLRRINTGFVKFGNLNEPFLVDLRGTSGRQLDSTARSIDDPLSTISAGGRHAGLVEPFLCHMSHSGGDRCHSVDVPLPTVCGNRGDMALIEAALLPQHSGGALRQISEPVPTIATDGAIALVEPYLVKYYGTALAQSIHDPLDTVTTKERHALVSPLVQVDGEQLRVRYRYRMLQPPELAGAQGFRDGYIFTGNKTEQVKQIGNAVPRHMARALVAACLSQNSDVSWLWNS